MTPLEIAQHQENGSLGSFSTKLMNLIESADIYNKLKIAQCFPEYIEAYNIWYLSQYKNKTIGEN